eukprot:c47446_g1_i1.p1 GENE.c47446_g1_i1~~c47446_g1_i1.p1  ORF type:complete len:414 (-),score=64.99 c47446_g1_i1:37-1278(-)
MPPVLSTLSNKEKAKNVQVLLMSSLGTITSICVLFQATPMIVLQHCKGNSQLALERLNQMASAAAFLQFLLNPVFGGLSDKYGRKIFLMIAPIVTALCRFLVVAAPPRHRIVFITIGRILTGALIPAFLTSLRASFVDMYAGDSPTLSNLGGKCQASLCGALVLGATIGGRLTATNMYLPYAASGVLGVAVLAAIAGWYKETLPPEKRKPFETRLKLLSFVDLFSLGLPIAAASAATALMAFPENMGDVLPMYLKDHMKWGPTERGNLVAVSGILAAAAGIMTGPAISQSGGRLFTLTSNAMATTRQLLMWWGMPYAAVVTGAFGDMRQEALTTLLINNVPESYGQGRLGADRANLLAVVQFVAPLLYSRLWRQGLAQKQPGLPFKVTAGVLTLAQLLVLLVPADAWDGKRRN